VCLLWDSYCKLEAADQARYVAMAQKNQSLAASLNHKSPVSCVLPVNQRLHASAPTVLVTVSRDTYIPPGM